MKRTAWIDHAKGLCIILVVMLYAVESGPPGAGESWLAHVASFAKPFRMPDFFLVSGLLLSSSIAQDWRTYLDRKVAHFAYFYVLWLAILIAFESPWIVAKAGWPGVAWLFTRSLWHPYSMLWFIYLLPVFFLATRLLRASSPMLVWLLAAALQSAQLDTGVKVFDKFAAYYVFFYTGYAAAPRVLAFAERVRARPAIALAGLAAWAALDAWLVFAGYAGAPGASLVLAFLGAAAVVSISALVCASPAAALLAYCGRNSLAIYLAFYVPLTLTHKLLVESAWVPDPGWTALLATAGGIGGALALRQLTEGTRLAFLFRRPAWFFIPADGALRARHGEQRRSRARSPAHACSSGTGPPAVRGSSSHREAAACLGARDRARTGR